MTPRRRANESYYDAKITKGLLRDGIVREFITTDLHTAHNSQDEWYQSLDPQKYRFDPRYALLHGITKDRLFNRLTGDWTWYLMANDNYVKCGVTRGSDLTQRTKSLDSGMEGSFRLVYALRGVNHRLEYIIKKAWEGYRSNPASSEWFLLTGDILTLVDTCEKHRDSLASDNLVTQ